MRTKRVCESCGSEAVRFVAVHLSNGTFSYGYCNDHSPNIANPQWLSIYDIDDLAIGGKRTIEVSA